MGKSNSRRGREAADREARRQAEGPQASSYAAKGQPWRPDGRPDDRGWRADAQTGETAMAAAFAKGERRR